jgi:hypothetical protein
MSSIFNFVSHGNNSQEHVQSLQEKPLSPIFEEAKKLPEQKEPSRWRSLISAPIKGVLEGAEEFAELFPGLPSGVGSGKKLRKKVFERVLPTQDKPAERYLQKAGKISTYVAGPGKLIPKLIRGAVATLSSQTAKEVGAPGWAQTSLEIGSLLTPTSVRGAQKYISSLYGQAQSLLPEGATTSAKNLGNNIRNFLKSLRMGGTATSKNAAMTKGEEILAKIKKGKIDVKELTEFKKTLNEARSGLYAEKSLDKAGRRSAKRHLDTLSGHIEDSLKEYGKTNPKWYEPYKMANEGHGAIENSKKASRWIGNLIKQHPHVSGATIAGTLIGHALSPVTAAGTAAGYGVLKSWEVLSRIAKSKTLRKYYSDMMKSAVKESAPGFLNNLKKLNNALEKEED